MQGKVAERQCQVDQWTSCVLAIYSGSMQWVIVLGACTSTSVWVNVVLALGACSASVWVNVGSTVGQCIGSLCLVLALSAMH